MEIRSILVPTDFSESSRAALQYAGTLARAFDAQIELVHAWDAAPYVPMEAVVGTLHDGRTLADIAHEQAEQQMAEWLAAHRELRIHGATTRAGNPAHVILETAASKSVDLIVMGTHGRTGLSHLLMGSVAEKILRHAHCPVLTVRAPGRA